MKAFPIRRLKNVLLELLSEETIDAFRKAQKNDQIRLH